MSEDRFLTVREVAARLHLTEDGVRWRLRTGRLPGVRLGGTKAGWRVSERELQAWLATRRNEPGNPRQPQGK